MNIIYPMGLMAIFTLLYSVVVVVGRVKAMKKGHVSPKYFKEHVDDTPPSYVRKATRQWSNLYEVPVLFYAACAVILALRLDDQIFTYLAYGFVGLRVVQGYIHTTYNNINHRFMAFLFGLIIVLALWIRLLLMV
ncbi:MAG TPA: hypothetical protein ENI91_01020 [Sphingomonadales bacterium]|nr:hypothetical protein [Sphingomonadales bacterium]